MRIHQETGALGTKGRRIGQMVHHFGFLVLGVAVPEQHAKVLDMVAAVYQTLVKARGIAPLGNVVVRVDKVAVGLDPVIDDPLVRTLKAVREQNLGPVLDRDVVDEPAQAQCGRVGFVAEAQQDCRLTRLGAEVDRLFQPAIAVSSVARYLIGEETVWVNVGGGSCAGERCPGGATVG